MEQINKQELLKKIHDYRFHASSVGDLMAWKSNPLTEAQEETLRKLENKMKEGKELTFRQKETLNDLYNRIKVGPTLTPGGKTALDKILVEIIYGYKNIVLTKHTNKGVYVEDDSINLYNKYKGTNYTKNDVRYENDMLTGIPDIIDQENEMIIDIKSSWTADTFPVFSDKLPSKKYEWQLKAYMLLTGYTKGKVVYVLTDTPEHIIQNELYKWAYSHNIMDIPEDVEEAIRSLHTYNDIPLSLRIKEFDVYLHPEDIRKFEDTYRMAKNYMIEKLNSLLEIIKTD